MSERAQAIAAVQRRLAAALRQRDPAAELRAIAADESLPADLRLALAGASADGVAISALLVAKLRFNRLIQSSRFAGDWFERDTESFARAFRRWHESTPPGTASPATDARSFEAHAARSA